LDTHDPCVREEGASARTIPALADKTAIIKILFLGMNIVADGKREESVQRQIKKAVFTASGVWRSVRGFPLLDFTAYFFSFHSTTKYISQLEAFYFLTYYGSS
jgi:hypothetical protein